MAIHLPPDGDPVNLVPKDHHTFTLQELQSLVGGYIEVVPLSWDAPDGRMFLVLNEDGKRLHLPMNAKATALLRQGAVHLGNDVAVGDVVVCSYIELRG